MSLLERVQSPKDLRALAEAELPGLCAELREEIISICGRVGGHLGASLGGVELIVALHRVFHAPEDDLVFDVGHAVGTLPMHAMDPRQLKEIMSQGAIRPETARDREERRILETDLAERVQVRMCELADRERHDYR